MKNLNGEQLQLGGYMDVIKKRGEERENKANNERADIVHKFEKIINESREKSDRKPYTSKWIAIKMSHLDLWTLKSFLQDCERANSFSAYWHWALNPQNCKNT
jgi:hypothetical protein